MANRVVKQAQFIEEYRAPQWLVQPVGDAEDEQIVSDINENWGYDVLEETVMGWGPYNAIIAVRIPGGPQHYLAQLGC